MARALFACSLLCAALASASALRCNVSGSGRNTTQERPVRGFQHLIVASPLKVSVVAGGNASMAVAGFENLMDQLTASADPFACLVLALKPGTCNSNLEVNLTVPAPLESIMAMEGGRVSAGTVAGSLSASTRSTIVARELMARSPVSVVASARSSVRVRNGSAPFVSVSLSSRSSADLGRLAAARATVAAASNSSSSGMEVGAAVLSVSSLSGVAITANRSVVYSCYHSGVNISGRPAVTEHANYRCQVNRGGATVATEALP